MREILDEIFVNQPLDPNEAARRTMARKLRRRFYAAASVGEGEGKLSILLDGKPIKTPARRLLATPSRPLAEALAAEWHAQGDVIDAATMPLTRLANTVIDGVTDAVPQVAAEIEKYLGSDLLVYRASEPAGLVARQAGRWDPILTWARTTLGAEFVVTEGVTYIAQRADALAAAAAAIPQEPWRLGAVHLVSTLTGSALIALALAAGAIDTETAWSAAHVDEDWNMDQWGRDEIALERRASRFAEMKAAALVLQAM
jgi:chaperone required for assembly of F1-ATPase